MKYVVLNPDSTVAYTFPAIDQLRPEIPVEKLYSAGFLAGCIAAGDDTEIESGYIYDSAAGAFSVPAPVSGAAV